MNDIEETGLAVIDDTVPAVIEQQAERKAKEKASMLPFEDED